MTSLAEILALRELDVKGAAAFLGVDADGEARDRNNRFGDVLASKPKAVRFVLDDDGRVKSVYIGEASLPAGTDHQALVEAVGSEGERLRSRQGKRANLHVVATKGVVWSELDGEVGFVELFEPTTFERYRDEVYEEPPAFRQ